MAKKPEDKLCPLRDKPCVRGQCQWWDIEDSDCLIRVSLYALNENVYGCYQTLQAMAAPRMQYEV